MSDDWYYELEGRRYGPMSFHDLQSQLQGTNLQNVFVWGAQYEDWKRAADIPELKPQPRQPSHFPSSAQRRADIQSPPAKKRPSRWKAFGRYLLTVAVGLIAAGLARALGPVFWIPALHVSVTWLILTKCKVSHAIIPVLAVLIGHMTWMLVGFGFLYATKGMPEPALWISLELVIVTGLIIWTIARQSIQSVAGILVYQLVALGNLTLSGGEAPVGPVAFAMHIGLRVVDVAAAIYAIVAIVRLRRQKGAS